MTIFKKIIFIFLFLIIANQLSSQIFANRVVLQHQLGKDAAFFTVRVASTDGAALLWNNDGLNMSKWGMFIDGKAYDMNQEPWIPYISQDEGVEKVLLYDDNYYRCIQELNIYEGQQYGSVKFIFTNNSNKTVVITPTVFLDTDIGDTKSGTPINPIFLTTRKPIENETELTGDSIPSWIQIPGGPSDTILTFIFKEGISDVPQKLVLANYFRFKASKMDFRVDNERTFETLHRTEVDKAMYILFEPRPVHKFSSMQVVLLFGIDKNFIGNDSFASIKELINKPELTKQDSISPRVNYLDDIDMLISEADALLQGSKVIDDESVEDLERKLKNLHENMSGQ